MKNLFPYTDDNKRYHTWNYHLRHKFGKKVCKISLNGGFTCPNIDGTKGYGGCVYCSAAGSGDFAGDPAHDLVSQFNEICADMQKKWQNTCYIPYFQAHTNTYAPQAVLRAKFEPVLAQPNVVGLSVATRADALQPDALDYLEELHKRTYLIVELGLQSVFDTTGEKINRCHTYAEFLEGYRALTARGIPVCVHLIDGLPGEDADMMIESARKVGELHPHCVKIHLLHVLKNTVLADWYAAGKVPVLSLAEYVDIIIRQLEVLPAETVIQRLTGDGARDSLIAPLWSVNKFKVLNEIDKEMVRRDTYQGTRFIYE